MTTYWVLGKHSWDRRTFDKSISAYPGFWRYIDDPKELTLEELEKDKPRYLFFMHWSERVPDEVTSTYECVCFHPTDLPYGRGGTPVQNLIMRGYFETKVSAFHMTAELDAGPIYLKRGLWLEGTAEQIYVRMNQLISAMILEISLREPVPVQQEGNVVTFKGRKPSMSNLLPVGDLRAIYDFIRMLDADGYPRAFVEWGDFYLEFSRASLYDGRVEASVKITERK